MVLIRTYQHPGPMPGKPADIKVEPRPLTLLGEVEAFLRRTHMSTTAFGRWAMNDGGFVFRLRKGANANSKTTAKVRAFMEQHNA